jgi:hypothetical protein
LYASFALSQVLLLAITLHAALIGSAAAIAMWRALPREADCFPLRAFFALSLGIALQMALLFVLGVAGGLAAPWLLAAGAATGALALARLAAGGAFKTRWGVARADFVVAAAFYVVVASSAARVPGYADDTMYHLPLARFYAETGGLGLDKWVRFPLFPQNMELLFALAFALRPGDVVLAEGLASLPAFVIALGLVGAGRWLRGSWFLGVAAGVAFLAMHVVDETLGYAYIDVGLASFSFATLLGAVALGARAPMAAYVALGVLAGAAAGCKLHGLVAPALAFAALAAFRAKPSALVAFAGAAALFGSGWYLRSYWISGDPISPAGGPWFGYFLWDATDLAGQRAEQATFIRDVKLTRFPFALMKAGANLVIPAIFAAFAARRSRPVVLALWAMFLAYALLWFYESQVDRYLAPVLAIGVLLSAIVVYDLAVWATERFAPYGLEVARMPAHVFAAVAALLIGYGIGAFDRAGGELRKWNAILVKRPGYVAFQQANALAPRYGSRLVDVGLSGSVYFYDGVAIGDWFGPGRYSQFVTFTRAIRLIPAAQMREALARFDARLLAVNLEFASFDEADYRMLFDVILNDGKQALLALKPGE